jgi:hypothetical protein
MPFSILVIQGRALTLFEDLKKEAIEEETQEANFKASHD